MLLCASAAPYCRIAYLIQHPRCFPPSRSFANKRVEVALWNSPVGDSIGYQYSDVIYAPGYYNCYTLVVNLSSVCDITRGATFVASPNDPMATKCVCPPSAPCADNPVVDFSQVCNWCLDMGTGIGA